MTAPRSDRRIWVVAAGLSLGPAVSNGVARFAYGLLLPAMRDDLGWSYAQAGWLNTANALGYLAGALLALRFIDRIGARRLFLFGMFALPVALAGSALATAIWAQSVLRILAGVAGAPAFIAGAALASGLFRDDPRRNALAIGLYFGGGGFGMVLTGSALPWLIEARGSAAWPLGWGVLAALALAALPPAWAAARGAGPRPARGETAPPLATGRMRPALIGYFLFSVGYIVYLTFFVAWLRAHDAQTALVAATWVLVGAGVMASPFLWRPVLRRSAGGGALALACAVTGIATLGPVVAPPTPAAALASAALFGLAFFMAPAAVTAFSRKNLPEAAWGRAVALFTTVFAVGQTLGPFAAGLISDAFRNLGHGMAAAGATLLLGALAAVVQRPFGGGLRERPEGSRAATAAAR